MTKNSWRKTEASRAVIPALAFVSGMGSVVYEVLYVRALTTVLGDMFYVHAALVGSFLFGIGLGAKLAHRFRGWLPLFELLIGLSAFTIPGLIRAYEGSAVSQLIADPVLQTVVLTLLLLAVPSVAVGFSIPLFADLLSRHAPAEEAFERTYLLYNLGAFLSILVVEFWLVRVAGTSLALGVVGSLNVLGALGLVALGVRPEPRGEDEAPPMPDRRRVSMSLFLASLAAAVFQGLYLKVCYHLFQPNRENFALCTGTIVLAIALGTAAAHRWRWRFETCALLAALAIGAIYVPSEQLFRLYETLWPDQQYAEAIVLKKLVSAFVLGGVPYLFLGALIPALLRRSSAVARDSGHLLFVSGCANGLGLLWFVFFLHSELPLYTIFTLVVGLLVAACLGASELRLTPLRIAALLGAAALGFVLQTVPEELVYFRHNSAWRDFRTWVYKSSSDDVSFSDDGKLAYVSYNGHPSHRIFRNGRVNLAETVSGIIPALVAPRLERAMVLGLGSGITAGTTARLFAHTDVVEINAAFFPLVRQIAAANFDIARNPAATVLHQDARRHLAAAGRRYDVIVNSIPSPTYYSAGKIYTAEFFDLVRHSLAPDGVYCTWFTGWDMSVEGVDTLVKTLRTRFKTCNLAVLREGYYFASCSDRPLQRRSLADLQPPGAIVHRLHEHLGQVPLDVYFESIFVSSDIFERFDSGDAPLNTDDFPALEFQILRWEKRRDPYEADIVGRQPERFGVEIPVPADRALLQLKGRIFAEIHPRFYERYLQPALRQRGLRP